ncbi:hypothetical protein SAMN05421819_4064 [Bryocella elongata]|uniref:Uncharacterized protein n=2 Tax=Bryocella elongata TaxID=863522 RepID=A0A1H6BYG5_9BACT|nr:hypothetical protein SAMN05421819_4064 [Bryocella elongata]
MELRTSYRDQVIQRSKSRPTALKHANTALTPLLVAPIISSMKLLAWMIFLLGQNLSRLAIAVRSPLKPSDGNPLSKWRTWSTIRSSHWGER